MVGARASAGVELGWSRQHSHGWRHSLILLRIVHGPYHRDAVFCRLCRRWREADILVVHITAWGG